MERNQSENAVRQASGEPELPDLAVRALSDFERILAAEARVLETNLLTATHRLLDRLYIQSILIVMGAVGMIALLVSVALILHRWLPWWQVMGLIGISTLVAAEALRRSFIPSTASAAS
jgi:hypothetical protein